MAAVAAVFGVFNLQAQDVSFGPKAGVNFANLSGDIEDNDMLIGMHIGGAVELMFNENMGLQAELLYSMQGTKDSYYYKETIGGVTYIEEEEMKIKLNYINLPVMFKYYVANSFNVEVGPKVGFLTSAKSKFEYKERTQGGGFDDTYTESGEMDVKDNVKSVDFGLNFGLGYKLDNGLNFGARYNLGLTNINDVDPDITKISNGVIQVSCGFMF